MKQIIFYGDGRNAAEKLNHCKYLKIPVNYVPIYFTAQDCKQMNCLMR